jgi:hypothetical protein
MKRLILAASALAAATAAFAGQYDEPYSIITVDTRKSADPLLRKVIVNRVDGVTITSDNRAVVAPGSHKVTLDLPPRRGFHQATQNEMALDTKPCTRYYVAAKLDSTAMQTWTPVVRSEEPIGECMKKFQVAKAR